MMPLVLQQAVVLPRAVYIIWLLTLLVAIFVILPVTVYLLQRTLNAARSIENYFADMRDAGLGIAEHTRHITALDETIQVAGQIVGTTQAIEEHAATIETTLAGRVSRTSPDGTGE